LNARTQAPWLKPSASFVANLLAVCLLYIGYLLIRGLIARHIDVGEAIERGHDLADLERQLNLSFEQQVQGWAMAVPLAIPLLNAIYIWGHVPFLIVELAWLYIKHPRWFGVLRNGLILSAIPSVVLYITLPTAPPRLNPELALVDTVAGPNHSDYFIQPAVFANHFAAIPSMHVGWALAAGLAAFLAVRTSRWRWLGVAMPVAMTASVMGTANHYVLDWVIGCAIAAACFVAAWMWDRRCVYNISITHVSERDRAD
jgi:hypothetical protein